MCWLFVIMRVRVRGEGYYTRNLHISPSSFPFPKLATNTLIISELFLIGFPVTRLPVHKSIKFSSTIYVHVIIDFPTTLPENIDMYERHNINLTVNRDRFVKCKTLVRLI